MTTTQILRLITFAYSVLRIEPTRKIQTIKIIRDASKAFADQPLTLMAAKNLVHAAEILFSYGRAPMDGTIRHPLALHLGDLAHLVNVGAEHSHITTHVNRIMFTSAPEERQRALTLVYIVADPDRSPYRNGHTTLSH